MIRFNRIAAAALAAASLGLALPAFASEAAYPRVVGTGENATVEYGPSGSQNLVGGGAVSVRTEGDGEVTIRHTDPSFMQSARQGIRAVTVGSGESQRTIWLRRGEDAATASIGLRPTRG